MRIPEPIKKQYGTLRGKFSKPYATFWLATLGRTVPFGDPCESPHETVVIDEIPLDSKIAPLIEFLWSNGIQTLNSCQGDPKLDERAFKLAPNFYNNCYSAYITVGSLEDARTLSELLIEICEQYELPANRCRIITHQHDLFHVDFPASVLILEGFLKVYQQ